MPTLETQARLLGPWLPRGLLVLILVWCGGCTDESGSAGDGGQEAIDSGANTDSAFSVDEGRLVYLRMEQQGHHCFENCDRAFTIAAPGTLILEDAEGSLEFQVTREAFAELERVVLEPDFATMVADSLARRDCFGHDIGITMTFMLGGETEQGPIVVDNCASGREKSFAKIFNGLISLMRNDLACPPWEEPAGFQLAVDPLPQRALCYFCYGMCQQLEE